MVLYVTRIRFVGAMPSEQKMRGGVPFVITHQGRRDQYVAPLLPLPALRLCRRFEMRQIRLTIP
jgi:hypothetical protein